MSNRKIFFYLGGLLFLIQGCRSDAVPQPLDQTIYRVYRGKDGYYGIDVARLPDGGYLILARSSQNIDRNGTGSVKSIVLKTDSAGIMILKMELNTELGYNQVYAERIKAFDGVGFGIIGAARGNNQQWNHFLIFLNSTGGKEWGQVYDCVGNCESWGRDVTFLKGGSYPDRFVITGEETPQIGSLEGSRVLMHAVSRSRGATIWRSANLENMPGYDAGTGIISLDKPNTFMIQQESEELAPVMDGRYVQYILVSDEYESVTALVPADCGNYESSHNHGQGILKGESASSFYGVSTSGVGQDLEVEIRKVDSLSCTSSTGVVQFSSFAVSNAGIAQYKDFLIFVKPNDKELKLSFYDLHSGNENSQEDLTIDPGEGIETIAGRFCQNCEDVVLTGTVLYNLQPMVFLVRLDLD